MTLLTLADVDIAAQSVRALMPAVAIGALGFGALAWRTRPAPHDRAWIAPLTLGAAAIVTHPLIHGGFSAPWSSAEHLIPIAALAAMVMGLLARSVRFALVTRWAVRALVLIALALIALRRIWLNALTFDVMAWLSSCTACALLAWAALEHTTDRTRGVSSPTVITLYASAASIVIALTGSHSLALSCAAIAATSLPAALLALFSPNLSLACGGAHVPALLLPFVLLIHLTLGASPPNTARVAALLIVLIPLASSIADWPHILDERSPRQPLLRLSLAALMALVAATVAARGFTIM